MARGLVYRYQGLDKKGKVIKSGNRLMDVMSYGLWLIIDYKLKRYAYQPLYPPTRQAWCKLTSSVKKKIATAIRRNVRR